MKISVRQITKNGYDVSLNSQEPWLVGILKNIFPEGSLNLQSVKGHLHLDNIDGNVNVSGQIEFDHTPLCARCGEDLKQHERVSLAANLIPYSGIDGEEAPEEEEEKELTTDDLGFAFYEGEEVDVGPIINDEIALALPYNYYCRDTKACDARQQEQFAKSKTPDPRWAALQEIKNKRPI